MNLNELILRLQELQSEGYGEKDVVLDSIYNTYNAKYDEVDDIICIY